MGSGGVVVFTHGEDVNDDVLDESSNDEGEGNEEEEIEGSEISDNGKVLLSGETKRGHGEDRGDAEGAAGDGGFLVEPEADPGQHDDHGARDVDLEEVVALLASQEKMGNDHGLRLVLTAGEPSLGRDDGFGLANLLAEGELAQVNLWRELNILPVVDKLARGVAEGSDLKVAELRVHGEGGELHEAAGSDGETLGEKDLSVAAHAEESIGYGEKMNVSGLSVREISVGLPDIAENFLSVKWKDGEVAWVGAVEKAEAWIVPELTEVAGEGVVHVAFGDLQSTSSKYFRIKG